MRTVGRHERPAKFAIHAHTFERLHVYATGRLVAPHLCQVRSSIARINAPCKLRGFRTRRYRSYICTDGLLVLVGSHDFIGKWNLCLGGELNPQQSIGLGR